MATTVFKYHSILTFVKKLVSISLLSGLLFCFVYDSIGWHYTENFELTELVDIDVENDVEEDTDKDVILFSAFLSESASNSSDVRIVKKQLFSVYNYKSSPPTPPPDFS